MSEVVLFSSVGDIHAKVMAWNQHRESLLESLKHCHGSHTEDDVLARVIAGEYHMWHSPEAAVVAWILQYPQFKAMNAFITGGTLEGLYAMAPQIATHAVKTGCKRIIGGGRMGWLRESGAVSMGTLMYKDL